jgi:multidrug resistance efflux pump
MTELQDRAALARDPMEARLGRLRLEPDQHRRERRDLEPSGSHRASWWAALAGALGLGALLVWAPWRASAVAPRPSAEPLPARTAAAPPAPAAEVVPPARRQLVFGGYVRAQRQVHLGAAVSGVVRAMLVAPGTRVAKGERIAELANDTLKALVEQAQATAAARLAELEELRHGPLPAELDRAAARTSELRAELERARRQLDRQQALHENGLVARADLDQAQGDHAVAASRLEVAQRDEELLSQGARPERLRRAEAGLTEAQAALDLARAQVEQTVIRSPIDGVVTKQHAQVGELVSAGFGGGANAAIVTIADTSRLVVEIDVPLAELRHLRLGQRVRVESEALAGEEFAGEVSWIGPEANRQKLSIPIEVEMVGASPALLPGLSAKVTLLLESSAEDRPAAGGADASSEEVL